MQYWLMKSEPDVFSIEDLRRDGETLWEGVRNYVARNYMVKEMRRGDQVLFYHSNAKPSAVVGLARVSSEPEADPTQFDRKSDYFDPKSTRENPRWRCVRVKFVKVLPRPVSLEEIKSDRALKNMVLLKQSRLSVQPVTKAEFNHILKLTEVPK